VTSFLCACAGFPGLLCGGAACSCRAAAGRTAAGGSLCLIASAVPAAPVASTSLAQQCTFCPPLTARLIAPRLMTSPRPATALAFCASCALCAVRFVSCATLHALLPAIAAAVPLQCSSELVSCAVRMPPVC